MTLLIVGLASGKTLGPFKLQPAELSLSLMDFLLDKKIPVASSCNGKGVCQKCIMPLSYDNKTLAEEMVTSCQTSLKKLAEKHSEIIVKLSYF